MSNYPSYPPSTQTPSQQTPQRRPQSGRQTPARRRRSARKRKKPVFWTLNWWQIVVLLALGVCIGICAVSRQNAGRSMTSLLNERDSARRAYDAQVANHRGQLQSLAGVRDMIEYYAAVNGIDPAFVSAVIKRESDFDPRATSRLGARGLMQIMPVNREWLAGKIRRPSITEEDMYDPETNIQMGCWYLGYLSDMFDGDPILVASAYHAGQNNVKSWLSNYSNDGIHLSVAQIPTDDTRYYAGKVLDAYAIYQQQVFTD